MFTSTVQDDVLAKPVNTEPQMSKHTKNIM